MSTCTDLRRFIPVLALAALVIVALACGETTPTSKPTIKTATPEPAETPTSSEQLATTPESTTQPTEAPTEPPEPTSEPAPTDTPEPQLLHLGEVAQQYGYLLSAMAVEDPATRPGLFYEPEEGKKLVAVEFIVGNVSGETFSSNVLYATLIDAEGFAYGAESGAVEDSIELLDLTPGEKARGWAGFIVPQDAVPASFKYAIRGSSSKVLQVGLAQPEGGQAVEEPEFIYTPDPGLPKLGDVVENFGYSLSVTTVEDPATRPGLFYEPEEGKKLVAVEFIVGNVSGETFSSNVLYAMLIDAEGFAYGAESGAVEDSIELLDLTPGEKARGWAGFIVPQDAVPASFKYAIKGSSSKVLQVRLISE